MTSAIVQYRAFWAFGPTSRVIVGFIERRPHLHINLGPHDACHISDEKQAYFEGRFVADSSGVSVTGPFLSIDDGFSTSIRSVLARRARRLIRCCAGGTVARNI